MEDNFVILKYSEKDGLSTLGWACGDHLSIPKPSSPNVQPSLGLHRLPCSGQTVSLPINPYVDVPLSWSLSLCLKSLL